MTRLRLLPLLIALLVPVLLHGQARDDQFKKDAFSQNYNDTTRKEKTDSTQLFSFRQYFGSLAHKRPGQIQNLFMGSTVFVGGSQIYNRQYWKLPVVYGGIGAGVGMGIHFNNKYKNTGESKYKTISTLSFVGAGLVWWGSLLDGTMNFQSDKHPDPGKATVYSILFPGMGQIYNGEYWKIPIYWGAIPTTSATTSGISGSTTRPAVRIRTWRNRPSPPKTPSITGTCTGDTGTIPSWLPPCFTSSKSWMPMSSPTCRTSRSTTTSPSGWNLRSSPRITPRPPGWGSASPSDSDNA